METNVNYTIVGAFIISLVAAIVLAIIWLSSGFSTDHYQPYAINMQESVSGLNEDSPVEFNGVEVGSVRSIKIDENDPRLVQLVISVKSKTPVSQGTVAMLASKGITGITYISLKDKGENQSPITLLNEDGYPIIKTAPSLFVRMDQALSQLSENFHKVADSINALLNKENLEYIHATLDSLKQITANLAGNSEKINAILANTAVLSKRLDPLIISSTSAMRTLEVQTLPATYRILTNLESITRSLMDTTAEIKENPSIIIRGVNRNNYGPGEQR